MYKIFQFYNATGTYHFFKKMYPNTTSAEDIQKLIDSVKGLDHKLKERLENIQDGNNKTLVFLLGPTGSGKTTLFYELINKPLNVIDGIFGPTLEAVEELDDFKIGQTMTAETDFPGIYYDEQNDVIYCDCPGFFDNRGEIQDIINSFAIYKLSTFASKIKIILLTAESDILSTRAHIFNENTKMVEKLVQDQHFYENSTAMLISKSSRVNVDGELIDRLNFDHKSSLLQALGERELDRVFLFQEPTNEMINQQYTDFHDRDRLFEFITMDSPIISKPFHISLSESAKLMILNSVDIFGSLPKILDRFVRLIIKDISFQTNVNDNEIDAKLDIMNQRINLLSSTDYPDPESFVNKAREIINPSTPEYDKIYEDTNKLIDWRSFLNHMISDLDNADRIRNDNSMMALFFDIDYFLKRHLNSCRSILTTMIEKRRLEKQNEKTNQDLVRIQEIAAKTKEETDKEMKRLYSQLAYLGEELQRARNEAKNKGGICILQ